MNKQAIILTVIICLFLVFQNDLAAQCAMCKQAAASSLDKDPNSIARGLNSGILYLMAVPYLAILFIFRKQIYLYWKKLRGKNSVETN